MGTDKYSEKPTSLEDMADEKDIQKEIAKNEGELKDVQGEIKTVIDEISEKKADEK